MDPLLTERIFFTYRRIKVYSIVNCLMDSLSLRNYSRVNALKEDVGFLEFFINEKPLSEILDLQWRLNDSILDSWTGVLGFSRAEYSKLIKLKQLLRQEITADYLRSVLSSHLSDDEIEYYIDKYNDELADPQIIIYCCAQCGDYDCGGVTVNVDILENAVRWSIGEENKLLAFEFDKYEYYTCLKRQLAKFQK